MLVAAEVDGGSERGCDRGLRGLCGPNVSMVTSPDKKSVKTLCGILWALEAFGGKCSHRFSVGEIDD